MVETGCAQLNPTARARSQTRNKVYNKRRMKSLVARATQIRLTLLFSVGFVRPTDGMNCWLEAVGFRLESYILLSNALCVRLDFDEVATESKPLVETRTAGVFATLHPSSRSDLLLWQVAG